MTSPTQSSSHSKADREIAGQVGWATLLLAVVGVLYLALVRSRWGQEIDEKVYLSASSGRDRLLDAAHLVHDLVPLWALLAIVVAAAHVLRPAHRRQGLGALAALALAAVSSEAVKRWVLSRPELVDTALPQNSLPSSRATVICAAALVLLALMPHRWFALAVALAVPGITLTAYAAVIDFGHRPSDIVAGVLLGGASVALLVAPRRTTAAHRRLLLGLVVGLGAVSVVLILLAPGSDSAWQLYATGVVPTCAAAAAVVLAMTRDAGVTEGG